MFLNNIRSRFGSRVFFFFVALSLSWALSIGVGFGEDVTPEDEKAYKEAMEDTEVAEQTEISTRLLAVVPRYDTLNDGMLHGSSITWENPADPSNSRVLVETMVNNDAYGAYYEPYLGQNHLLTASIWVTVVPELKNHFIGKSCPPTVKRIKQLKGLNPAKEYSWLVQLWVEPQYLFRPAPDPEITDHEGELSVRIAKENWTFPSDDNAFVTLIDEALYLEGDWALAITYRDWFSAAAEPSKYDTSGPIEKWQSPWTRLGYTYDWGDSDDHLGVSEFRVVLDTTVKGRVVGYKDAVDLRDDAARAVYFRCVPEGTGGGSSGGCFVKTPH